MIDTRLILDVLQTLGVMGALFSTGYEIRARRREQRFRNYLDATAGAVDVAKMMVENRDLHPLYESSARDATDSYERLTPAERARVHYCDLILALAETVWVAHREGWLPSDEWPYWKTWVDQLRNSKDFRWTANWVKDDYDPQFLADVGAVHTM